MDNIRVSDLYLSKPTIGCLQALGCRNYQEVLKLETTSPELVRMPKEVVREILAFIDHEQSKLALIEAKRLVKRTGRDLNRATNASNGRNWDQPEKTVHLASDRQPPEHIRSPSGATLRVKRRYYSDAELTKSGKIRASSEDLEKKRQTAKLLDELGV